MFRPLDSMYSRVVRMIGGVCFLSAIVIVIGTNQIPRLDIVIVPPASPNRSDLVKVKQSWPHRLGMPGRKLGVIVLEAEGKVRVVTHLVGGRTKISAAFNRWEPNATAMHNHARAFKLMREDLFDFSNPERAKVVILFMTQPPSNLADAKMEAKKLRDKGAFIYVVCDSRLNDIASSYTKSKTRIFASPLPNATFSAKALDVLDHIFAVATRDICTICRFKDASRKICEAHKRPPSSASDYFGDKNKICETSSLGDINCTKAKCEEECDRDWPWEDVPECAITCGVINRYPSTNAPPLMEHCQRLLRCGPCRTSESSMIKASLATTETPRLEVDAGLIIGITIAICVIVAVIIVAVKKMRGKKLRSRISKQQSIDSGVQLSSLTVSW